MNDDLFLAILSMDVYFREDDKSKFDVGLFPVSYHNRNRG